MSVPALRQALQKLDEKSCCEGTLQPDERVAIMLPDGDVGAVDDKNFVDWLLEHSEPAPFGEGGATKIDPRVRRALRLEARDKATVTGFDPADVLGEIEAALSPREHLAAKLTDVLVYPVDGKFWRHKDTPRSPELVGTLVVGLPIAHEGGAFHVEDGRDPQIFDWSGTPQKNTVRWVALFGDVDHEVKPVTAGARVTLVYALMRTNRPRKDPSWDARRAKLEVALQALAQQTDWPVMIACTRHVITDEKTATSSIETLRGMDRDLADALVGAGFEVTVRSCLTAGEAGSETPPRFPSDVYSVSRLKKPITKHVIRAMDDIVTFTDGAEDDEGEDIGAYSLAPYILDSIDVDQWVIRDNAAATMIHEALFSDSGYFGNEAYQAYLYTLAALEVSKGLRVRR